MRNHQPVARIGKTCVLTCYQDVFQALKERAFISSGIPKDLHAELKKECLSLSTLCSLFSKASFCLKMAAFTGNIAWRYRRCLQGEPGLR